MKTALTSRIGLTLLSMLIVLNSFAQKSGFNNQAAFKFSSYEIKSIPSLNNNVIANTEKVNAKILKQFNKEFRGVNDVNWSKAGSYFLSTFVKDEVQTKTLFNKNGGIIYSIDFGSEKILPKDVRGIVKSKYYDYNITSVAKVAENDRLIWVIKMADELNYKTARVENGEMEEVENFKKAN